ncbi:transposase [Bradyrhizobium sp. WSM 1744]|uniref:Transposase n=1 Tax=Bradyrhizobium archetypum TaxID=2721160 RepID=A0A7Y4M5I0_9BRAD|nr:transposase [Bradyrhizobium archetypum]
MITGQRRRRRWRRARRPGSRRRALRRGANISEVARRNGVARGLLTIWRTRLRRCLRIPQQAHEQSEDSGVDDSGMVRVTKWLHQGASPGRRSATAWCISVRRSSRSCSTIHANAPPREAQ